MKKLLSTILTAAILSSAAANAEELSKPQRMDLYNFGIMVGDENGDLRLNDSITRAEAVKMICTAGMLSASPQNAASAGFPDVPDTHWAAGYIQAAKESGIVAGDENGNFNPEKSVTNEEFVKMLVCLLGYGDYAPYRGGFPAGYTAMAADIGLTDNVTLEVNAPTVRSNAAILVCNALDIPLLASEDVGDGTNYYRLDGSNGLAYVTLRTQLLGVESE